jgi:hypothetical protein
VGLGVAEVAGSSENKAKLSQPAKLELGLSLAIMPSIVVTSLRWCTHSAQTNKNRSPLGQVF